LTSLRTSRRALALFCFCLSISGACAFAQGFPVKPIRMIVPYAPGGASDVVARMLSVQASKTLGQQIVIENKAGAGGTIGAAEVAKAPADGYTLLLVAAGHAGSGALYPSLDYDPVKSFSPVIGAARLPIVVAVSAASKYKSLADLVADAKARPGKLNYAGGGGGATVTNLAAQQFLSDTKLDIVSVPYKGSAPALTALLAGEVEVAFDVAGIFMPHIQAGKLRALAVTTRKRFSLLPEVPTIAEHFVPGFDAYAWIGVLAPAGTPPAVVAKLNHEFNAALRQPDVVATLRDKFGAEPMGGPPAQFGSFLASEADRWGALIRKLGLKPN
jgi:tripartite-type tricarboxylate transporter receptor subunit TctC